jgi:hypothetical protein
VVTARSAPEFPCEFAHATLLARRQVRRRRPIRDFVRRPGSIENLLKLLQRRCSHRPARAAKNGEAHRTVERRELVVRQRSRELLGQPEARNADRTGISRLDVVVDRHFPPANDDGVGQRQPALALLP